MSILAGDSLSSAASAPVGDYCISFRPYGCGLCERPAPCLRMKARDGRGHAKTGINHMSQLITQADLEGMNEQELWTLYRQIIADLKRRGQSAQDCPHIFYSLRNILATIARLQAPRPVFHPRGPKGPGL